MPIFTVTMSSRPAGGAGWPLPSRSLSCLAAAPACGEVRHVLTTAHGVVEQRHVRLDVGVEGLLGDVGLRQHPWRRDRLALERHDGRYDGGAPLESRVGGGDGGEALFLPLDEE